MTNYTLSNSISLDVVVENIAPVKATVDKLVRVLNGSVDDVVGAALRAPHYQHHDGQKQDLDRHAFSFTD